MKITTIQLPEETKDKLREHMAAQGMKTYNDAIESLLGAFSHPANNIEPYINEDIGEKLDRYQEMIFDKLMDIEFYMSKNQPVKTYKYPDETVKQIEWLMNHDKISSKSEVVIKAIKDWYDGYALEHEKELTRKTYQDDY